jgi:hypothetical protein
MRKQPAKAQARTDAAPALTVPERILLFCVASGTEWERAGITGAMVTATGGVSGLRTKAMPRSVPVPTDRRPGGQSVFDLRRRGVNKRPTSPCVSMAGVRRAVQAGHS